MNYESPPDATSAQQKDSLFVVGIGASAGGLEALEHFFTNVPENSGLAYVVVQHLAPEHPSLMGELLARQTRVPVEQASHGTVVQPNRIYLNPPNKEMIIANGQLLLTDRPAKEKLSLPIDHFLRSLARECGPRSIGVILSGTGTDGSRGICDIHDVGGLVLVQSEETAGFDGMPRAARDTGRADAVLSPDEMPAKLLQFLQHPLSRQWSLHTSDSSSAVDDGMNRIISLLRNKYGIDFSQYKASTITRRIERRLMLHQAFDVDEYAERLQNDRAELANLYRDLLIGVTRFFRDAEAFSHLDQHVIPELIRKAEPNGELRVWVAGAGTGEEAYSIAMLLSERLQSRRSGLAAKIFATDVHHESLEKAARGLFSDESLREINAERLQRFFVKREHGYQVAPDLRKMIVFAPHNVIRDAPFTSLDLVTCRNLLIYLTPQAQRKALSLFHFALKVGGVLWLGPSESLGEIQDEFSVESERWRIYQKLRDVRVLASSRYPAKVFQRSGEVGVNATRAIPAHLLETYDKLLEEHMPPSVLITERRTLTHAFAGASQFLQYRDGRPTHDIVEMVNPELRTPLVMAIQRALQEKAPVVYAGIRCSQVSDQEIKLVVKPLFNRTRNERDLLVTFETNTASPAQVELDAIDLEGVTGEQIGALESELRYTKQSLQSTIEELESTNEELQAANEELTASNEELQSTNQELHSVNEELYTVNAEYQRKIAELTEVTDDMENLLNSTHVDTVFLDRELRIRKFTPGVAKTINLIPQDIGRRIDSFTHNILDVDVLDMLDRVLRTQESIETEVRDTRDRWHLLRVLPYVSKKDVDGVVLTLIEITSLKEAEARLTELSEVVEQSGDVILRLDLAGTIRTWNRGAETLLGYSFDDVVGKHISLLVPDDEDGHIQGLLEQVMAGRAVHSHRTVWRGRDGVQLDVSLHASPIRDASHTVVGASAIARDISELKRAEMEIREAVRRRDQFLAMLSHELRNPLAAILNATSLLKEEALDEDSSREAREVVEHQLQHVARLLDDLLDVARITNDKLSLHREVVDLSKLVLDIVDCVQHQIDEAEQQLDVDVAEPGLFVEGDIGRLQQAQVNLLVNASKYSPPGSTIRYKLKRGGNNAVISVCDSGEGIPAEIVDQIFEPFVQVEQTLDRSQGGMGLGLALVRMIAEAHGGSVVARSEGRGQGSQFTIHLPLTNAVPSRRQAVYHDAPDNTKLLLIEDNAGIRAMLARTLQLKGFQVDTASDGREGVEKFASFQPRVAIVDIGLPDIDGYDLARHVRASSADVLLVAVTGYGREEDRKKAVASGFDLHLVKPIDPAELVSKISTLLSRGSASA